MTIVKYLYKSQFVLDEKPIAGSTNPVTSDGILKALNDLASNKTTLVQSGFMTDCIAGLKKNFTLSDKNDIIRLGSETEVQTLYIPAGKVSGKAQFTIETLEAGEFIEGIEDVDTLSANNCDTYICYDYANKKLIALPARTAITGSLGVIQSMFAQTTPPAVTAENDGCYWWDLTTNTIKQYSGEWLSNTTISLPLALGRRTNKVTKRIITDFSISGACCEAAWLLPGVTFVVPDHRKAEDNTLNVVLLETDEVLYKDVTTGYSRYTDYYLYLTADGIVGPDDLAFNFIKGCYEDRQTGEEIIASRFGIISSDYVNPNNITEPLYVSEYSPFTVSTFANTNDISSVAKEVVTNNLETILENYSNNDDLGGLIDALTIQIDEATIS